MNEIMRRTEQLRAQMKAHGVDAYIVPTSDFHETEYVCDYFKARAYMSGFTGSAGTCVFTAKEGKLWTDGRYFIQAAKQLEGSGIDLMRMGDDVCRQSKSICWTLCLSMPFWALTAAS